MLFLKLNDKQNCYLFVVGFFRVFDDSSWLIVDRLMENFDGIVNRFGFEYVIEFQMRWHHTQMIMNFYCVCWWSDSSDDMKMLELEFIILSVPCGLGWVILNNFCDLTKFRVGVIFLFVFFDSWVLHVDWEVIYWTICFFDFNSVVRLLA